MKSPCFGVVVERWQLPLLAKTYDCGLYRPRTGYPLPTRVPQTTWRVSVRRLALLASLLLGISNLLWAPPAPASAQSKLKVVATVAPITNIVLNVGGNRIDLEGII